MSKYLREEAFHALIFSSICGCQFPIAFKLSKVEGRAYLYASLQPRTSPDEERERIYIYTAEKDDLVPTFIFVDFNFRELKQSISI